MSNNIGLIGASTKLPRTIGETLAVSDTQLITSISYLIQMVLWGFVLLFQEMTKIILFIHSGLCLLILRLT